MMSKFRQQIGKNVAYNEHSKKFTYITFFSLALVGTAGAFIICLRLDSLMNKMYF